MKINRKFLSFFSIIILIIPIITSSGLVKGQQSEVFVKTSTKTDLKIHEEYLGRPKSKRITEILLGKIGANEVRATFTTDTMTFDEETYRSNWKQKDYCLIQYKENQAMIVGTHRYGTKAGALYYNKEKPETTTLIKWKDKNSDKEPQLNEIEVVD